MGRERGGAVKKVWVAFDALVNGIREGQLEEETEKPLKKGGWIVFIWDLDRRPEWFPAGTWYSTYKGAVKAANRKRDEKIKELERQIERLKRKVFE